MNYIYNFPDDSGNQIYLYWTTGNFRYLVNAKLITIITEICFKQYYRDINRYLILIILTNVQ